MSNLSARQFDIFKRLLDSEKLNIDVLSNEYGISKRTIYREINAINKYICDNYNVILSNEKDGIKLIADEKQIETIKMDFWTKRPAISIEERKKLILSELLKNSEPLKLDYFAKKFNVSSATISYDLKDIEKWLNEQDLVLVAKPGYGVAIEGNENDIRKAIINFLYENVKKDILIDVLNKKSYANDMQYDLDRYLKGIVDISTLNTIEKSIKKLAKEIEFEMVESSYMGLLIHLVLVVKRLEAGDKIDINPIKLRELKMSEEYQYAKVLAENLQKELNIQIPESEIGYITIHLKGARYKDVTKNSVDESLLNIVNSMISNAEEIFSANFKQDEVLFNGLLTHIGPAIDRLLSGLDIRNPLIDDIKSKYADLFTKTKAICKTLEREINIPIPDDEIGYIAMHFGASIERKNKIKKQYNVLAVCASGIGTSRMMLSKLQLFPQLNVVDAVSSMKLDEALNKFDVDLIVSTIPIKNTQIKSVVVNPLLLEDDIKKIQNALKTDLIMDNRNHAVQSKRKFDAMYIAKYGKYLLDILENFTVIDLKQSNSKEIIREFLLYLQHRGYIKDILDIEEKLIGREELGALVLPERQFVIYHCITEHIEKPIISIGNLKNEVMMKNLFNNNERVRTAMLLLSPDDKASIRLIGDISAALIEDIQLPTRISSAKTKENMERIFSDLLKVKYMDEIRREMM